MTDAEDKYYERQVISDVGKTLLVNQRGEVWRIGRWQYNGRGQRYVVPITPTRRAESCATSGYYVVCSGTLRVYAHRLVWQFFHGDIPHGVEINHINGKGRDNHPSNLELVMHSRNMKHAVQVLGYRPKISKRLVGEAHLSHKLTEPEVREIRILARNKSQRALAEEYGVNQATIWSLLRRKTWKHVN